MRTRILIGAGAWLLGTAAATVGSTLAVSRMGQGIADAPSQQLTAAMVQRALASESAEAPTAAPSQSPTKAPAIKLGVTATPITRKAPSSRPSPAPTTSPSPQSPSGSVLTSEGGTVVAGCGTSGAYLQSWSPQQGYEAKSVVRGPATTAQVVFKSSQRMVTMTVSCSAGVPSAATQVQNTWGGDD